MSFTPRPSCAPASDAFAVKIAGAECSLHEPPSTPFAEDATDDSSALFKFADDFTSKPKAPTFVKSCAAAFVGSVIVSFTVVYEIHSPVYPSPRGALNANTPSIAVFVLTFGVFSCWSKYTVIVSFTPMPLSLLLPPSAATMFRI